MESPDITLTLTLALTLIAPEPPRGGNKAGLRLSHPILEHFDAQGTSTNNIMTRTNERIQ